jgi:lipopolysaccharide/colanic/teichoic acid biosynthesis glycosyltransferase
MRETLAVLPGITSPGSVRYYRDGGEDTIPAGVDAERFYGENLLPGKIALDLVYVSERSPSYDANVLLRTGLAVAGRGRRLFRRRERHEEARAAVIEAAIREELAGLVGP